LPGVVSVACGARRTKSMAVLRALPRLSQNADLRRPLGEWRSLRSAAGLLGGGLHPCQRSETADALGPRAPLEAIRWKQRLQNFSKAVAFLEEAAALPTWSRLEKEGPIQIPPAVHPCSPCLVLAAMWFRAICSGFWFGKGSPLPKASLLYLHFTNPNSAHKLAPASTKKEVAHGTA